MLTKIKLRDGTEHEFKHVEQVNLAPGFVILVNPTGKPVGMMSSTDVISIIHPENDTNIELPKNSVLH